MKKILIADDDLNFADIARDLLEHHGWICVIARSGVDALAKVKSENPDMILLDINMPQLDGYGVLRVLKSDSKTSSIPVVVCSITEEIKDIEQVKTLGAEDFIHKSLYLKHLVPCLDRYLGKP